MKTWLIALGVLAGCLAGPQQGVSELSSDTFKAVRQLMVQTQLADRDIRDPAVLEAMRKVPRHLFVPERYRGLAYIDSALPIGLEQTISQPYIVALMTQALQVEPGQKVLEIGTGSGYQAAVLAEMGARVFTIEIVPELAEQAKKTLQQTGYGQVRCRLGDGYLGWEEEAPFDSIIVTAAPDELPQPLADQLAEGGRLVVPVGPQSRYQSLLLHEKRDGKMKVTNLGPVRFVPLTRRP